MVTLFVAGAGSSENLKHAFLFLFLFTWLSEVLTKSISRLLSSEQLLWVTAL